MTHSLSFGRWHDLPYETGFTERMRNKPRWILTPRPRGREQLLTTKQVPETTPTTDAPWPGPHTELPTQPLVPPKAVRQLAVFIGREFGRRLL
jgi:hypothetical protein